MAYFRSALSDNRRENVLQKWDQVVQKHEFDSIAVRGLSGATMGGVLSYLSKKDLVVLRKNSDFSPHSLSTVELENKPNKFIIVDDLISSGNTIQIINNELQYYPDNPKCVAIFLYEDNGTLPGDLVNFRTRSDFDWCNKIPIYHISGGILLTA